MVDSEIAGFGLAPRQTDALDWSDLSQPVVMPLLGRETGMSSAAEADVFGRVLRGSFSLLTFRKLAEKWPSTRWRRRGHFVEAARGSERASTFALDEEILQVPLIDQGMLRPGDCAVYYLAKTDVCRLLHIPTHIFALLARHSRGHHADRHFATHVCSWRLGPDSHLLINAHPIFGESAFALGLVNEPADDETKPTLEMRLLHARAPRPRPPSCDLPPGRSGALPPTRAAGSREGPRLPSLSPARLPALSLAAPTSAPTGRERTPSRRR